MKCISYCKLIYNRLNIKKKKKINTREEKKTRKFPHTEIDFKSSFGSNNSNGIHRHDSHFFVTMAVSHPIFLLCFTPVNSKPTIHPSIHPSYRPCSHLRNQWPKVQFVTIFFSCASSPLHAFTYALLALTKRKLFCYILLKTTLQRDIFRIPSTIQCCCCCCCNDYCCCYC